MSSARRHALTCHFFVMARKSSVRSCDEIGTSLRVFCRASSVGSRETRSGAPNYVRTECVRVQTRDETAESPRQRSVLRTSDAGSRVSGGDPLVDLDLFGYRLVKLDPGGSVNCAVQAAG